MSGLAVLFYFPLFLSQGELKFGMVAKFLSSLVRALAKLPGGLDRFLPCTLRFSCVQVKASWKESVFSWFDLQTSRILSSSMS